MPASFHKFLLVSGLFHVLFAVLFATSPELFHFFPRKEAKVTWVRLTKGTGLDSSPYPFKKSKGMPASTVREQKSALHEIAKDKQGKDAKSVQSPVHKKYPVDDLSKKRASPEGGVNLDAKKMPREKRMEDALARVEEELKKREVEMEAAQIEKEGQGQSPYGSLDVPEGELNPILVAYYAELKKRINQQWIVTPKKLEEGQVLKTTINVLIDEQGNLISAGYEMKSGDASFDLSAMRAIERAAPFPAPPETIKQEAVYEGFLIEFSPRSVVGSV